MKNSPASVPFSAPVKRSLAAVAILLGLAGALEEHKKAEEKSE